MHIDNIQIGDILGDWAMRIRSIGEDHNYRLASAFLG